MYEWTQEDEEASREATAISKSLRNKQPHRPRGVSLQDIQKDKAAKILERLVEDVT